MRDTGKRLLLVEDDADLASMIAGFLDDEGFETERVGDGRTAIDRIRATSPDLVILDIMLPKADGIEVCRRVRPAYAAPILVVTAKDDDLVEVTSLGLGADGYLTKPVRANVLLAHVRALLRRADDADRDVGENRREVQDLVIDTGAMRLTRRGTEIALTTAEFQLLSLLASRAGTIVSRDEVCRRMRGIDYDGCDRSIDMRICTLRRKLLDDRPPYRYIKTVRGRGYLMPRS